MRKGPIIIIGMHRSGTTMLTNILHNLGIFMGWRRSINEESWFFYFLNDWIFRQANATVDNTYNLKFVDRGFEEELIKILNKKLKGPFSLLFLGPNKFIRFIGDIQRIEGFWGWKEPKNSFTIDIWKKIFPNAKIIHIYRNPIDTAQSLRIREMSFEKELRNKFFRRLIGKATLLGNIINQSLRFKNLEENIKIWEDYVSNSIEICERYKNDSLTIKYEDFLDNPEENIVKILKFIGKSVDREKILKEIKEIRADRKFAFIKDQELVKLYNKVRNKNLIKKLGYGSIL